MALSLWRDWNDFFGDPWQHWHTHRDVVPYSRHRHPWRDDFAFGLRPSDLLATMPKEFQQMGENLQQEMGEMIPTTGKDGFQVCLDVRQFSPKEITVKTNENSVIIEGKHEERQDEHGFISRQFLRRYTLPKGYDANTLTSELSSDGVLTIKASLPKALEGGSNERVVSIQQTGPAHLNIKENEAIKDTQSKL